MSKSWIATALAVLTAVAGSTAAQSDDANAALRTTRDTLAKWVETQQLISKEREDWAVGKDVLEQRIALLEGEIASLESKVENARTGIREADDKERELTVARQALVDALAGLSAAVDRLEDKTRSMLGSLPDPIRDRVDPLARRLPGPEAKEDMTLGQRFQNVIGILNEVNKFNGAITVTNELRELPDGSTAEVRTLYVGLGQAWYVSTRGDAAGVGRPSPDGWQWEVADDLAPRIDQAIKILENEDVPAYVPLPVAIR